MNRYSFTIPLYNINVVLLQVSLRDPGEELTKQLKKEGIDIDNISDAKDKQDRKYIDGGYTYYNFNIGKIVVLFFHQSTSKRRSNVYSHEKRHIEDRVLSNAGVDDIEAAAYLAGFLGEKFYEFIELVNKKSHE